MGNATLSSCIAPLDAEEELALCRRYQQTRELALEQRLVASQLALADRLASVRDVASADRDDLVQEGALGVVEAVRQFDPDRGIPLSSYADLWIRVYQLRWLLAHRRASSLAVSASTAWRDMEWMEWIDQRLDRDRGA